MKSFVRSLDVLGNWTILRAVKHEDVEAFEYANNGSLMKTQWCEYIHAQHCFTKYSLVI
jgi:hypothetical protein